MDERVSTMTKLKPVLRPVGFNALLGHCYPFGFLRRVMIGRSTISSGSPNQPAVSRT
jgi:hypothetical protein